MIYENIEPILIQDNYSVYYNHDLEHYIFDDGVNFTIHQIKETINLSNQNEYLILYRYKPNYHLSLISYDYHLSSINTDKDYNTISYELCKNDITNFFKLEITATEKYSCDDGSDTIWIKCWYSSSLLDLYEQILYKFLDNENDILRTKSDIEKYLYSEDLENMKPFQYCLDF
jgi:hypothetical protein